MSKQPSLPVALTIAGSDSGGGAGIPADLKTFAALGVHGTSAITCITAQNPARVSGIHICPPAMVRQQMEAVFNGFHPRAVKTGMLYTEAVIRAVAAFFNVHPKRAPLVVDPVMIATSGRPLLKSSAIKILERELLPLATLVTPNLDEAGQLTRRRLHSVEDMRAAAREIQRKFGCATLVKGGHLRGTHEAVDIYFDGETELLLTAPYVKGVRTHGTGCTYSAAITGYLALGLDLSSAVVKAKQHVTGAIVRHRVAGGHSVLENFWQSSVKYPSTQIPNHPKKSK